MNLYKLNRGNYGNYKFCECLDFPSKQNYDAHKNCKNCVLNNQIGFGLKVMIFLMR